MMIKILISGSASMCDLLSVKGRSGENGGCFKFSIHIAGIHTTANSICLLFFRRVAKVVHVGPPVFQIAHAAVGVKFIQKRKIHIRNNNHFGIWRGFAFYAVKGKSIVTRRKDN